MKISDKVQLLADAMYSELAKVTDSGLSEDAAIALLGVKILEMQENIQCIINERVKSGFAGRVRSPLKFIGFVVKLDKFQKSFYPEFKKLLDLAGDICTDAKFTPTQDIDFESAIKSLILDAFEEFGI